jgi:tRNA(fMet)-specific endonuclease VapC
LATFNQFLQGVTIVGLDQEIAETFARLRYDLRSRGQLIPDQDTWIAATAIRQDLILLTRDHHFDRIESLKRS